MPIIFEKDSACINRNRRGTMLFMTSRRQHYPNQNNYTDAANILYSEIDTAGGIVAYAEKRLQGVLAKEERYVKIARRVGSRIAFDQLSDTAAMPAAADVFVAGGLTGLDLGGLAHGLQVTDLSAVFAAIFDDLNREHHLRYPVERIIALGNVGIDICGDPASHLMSILSADFGPHRGMFHTGAGITLDGLRELAVGAIVPSENVPVLSKR